jgi:hypothetical protein
MRSEILPKPIQLLDAELSRLLQQSARNRTRLVSLALAYGGHEQIRAILRAVCESEQLLVSCASRSLAHPLGFDKFALLSSEYYQVRLHIWWPEGIRGREDIHNHRFSFISAVIVGQVNVGVYEIARPGTAMMRFREHRELGGSSYRYVQLDNVQVQQSGSSSFAAGSAYYLRSSTLHRVDVASGTLAATLFVRIPRLARPTTVLVHRGGNAPAAGARSAFSPAETRERLLAFGAALAA